MFNRIWQRLNILQKLKLVLMTTMLTLTAAMLIMARWSYEQGFFDYTNALETDSLGDAGTSVGRSVCAVWSKHSCDAEE